MSDTAIETPCRHICAVHPHLRLCIGCGRSLDEIARWVNMSAAERSTIMARLPARLAALGGAAAVATRAG